MEVTVVRPRVMAVRPGRFSAYVVLSAEGRVLSAGYTTDTGDVVAAMEEFLPEELIIGTEELAPDEIDEVAEWFTAPQNALASLYADYAKILGIRVTVYHDDLTDQFPIRDWQKVDETVARVLQENANLPRIRYVTGPLTLAIAHMLENGMPVA